MSSSPPTPTSSLPKPSSVSNSPKLKLNLGCGNNKLQGFINIDKYAGCRPDRHMNLEIFPWPFDSASVELVLARHVLEHVGQSPSVFCGIMQEIYRVLEPGGTLEVKFPHPRSDGFLGDPTHVRALTPQVFQLFSKRANAEAKAKNWPNTPLAEIHNINFELKSTDFKLTPKWSQLKASGQINDAQISSAIAELSNVVDEVTVVMYKVGMEV